MINTNQNLTMEEKLKQEKIKLIVEEKKIKLEIERFLDNCFLYIKTNNEKDLDLKIKELKNDDFMLQLAKYLIEYKRHVFVIKDTKNFSFKIEEKYKSPTMILVTYDEFAKMLCNEHERFDLLYKKALIIFNLKGS